MCVYCFEPVHSPVLHGAFSANPSNSASVVSASSTRTGVHQPNRRTPARRPHGPPMPRLPRAAIASTRLGRAAGASSSAAVMAPILTRGCRSAGDHGPALDEQDDASIPPQSCWLDGGAVGDVGGAVGPVVVDVEDTGALGLEKPVETLNVGDGDDDEDALELGVFDGVVVGFAWLL